MKCALLEWHYWPCIAYFQKIVQSDFVIFESNENFRRTSFINKCIIASANGPLLLSIPIKGGSRKKQIMHHVEISYDTKWQREHWHAITSAYAKSAYFEFYETELFELYQKKENSLVAWNKSILQWIIQTLNIEINLQYENQKAINQTDVLIEDDRESFSPKNYKSFQTAAYYQLFQMKNDFLNNLSILDLIMSEGPNSSTLLMK